MKIYSKPGTLNETERLEIARLLIKAGYTVKLGKDKVKGKTTYVHHIEYWEHKGEE